MPISTKMPLLQVRNNLSITITDADATIVTVPKLGFTAGADGSDVKSITATLTATAAASNVSVWVVRGGVNYLKGTVPVPVNSGFNGTAPSVDLLNPAYIPGLLYDETGKAYLSLAANDTLKFGLLATVAAGKTLTIDAEGFNS